MSSLAVFDFDFTIAKTYEKIWVWSPRGTREFNGKTYIPIHPSELQNRQLANDESITEESFSEFYDVDVTKAKLINPIIRHIKYHIHATNDKVIILTARPQCVEEKVIYLLEECNIDTSKIKFFGLAKTAAEEKVKFLSEYIKENNISSLMVYEDSVSVIRCVKESDEIIIPCEFAHVKHGNKLEICFHD